MDDRDRMRQIVSSLEICKITWLLFNATHRDATTYHTPVESISRVTQTIRPEDFGLFWWDATHFRGSCFAPPSSCGLHDPHDKLLKLKRNLFFAPISSYIPLQSEKIPEERTELCDAL